MSRWWVAPLRCGSALAALLMLQVSAAEEEPWLKRSREVLKQAEEQPAPEWLRQEPTREALTVAEDIAAQSRSARMPLGTGNAVTEPNTDGRVLIFGSFSIPEATLKTLLAEASQPNVIFILRGVPAVGQQAGRRGSITDAIARLRRIGTATGEVPNVIIDPMLFRRHGVSTVPTLVLERGDKKPVKVAGAMTLDWLRRQAATVAAGREDLGRRAENYPIAEADFVLEMQRRMAGIDWGERRRMALANFWRKPRQFVELPDAAAQREFLVDPSVRVTQDLQDADGNVLIQAGESFNPLNWAPLSKTIVVFRGTDARHVKTAAAAARRVRDSGRGVILLTTAVDTARGWEHLSDMERELAGAVYLLPPGLAGRFHLEHIPATIASRGGQLLVTELPAGILP